MVDHQGGARSGRLRERDEELRTAEQALDRLCQDFEAGGTEIGELLVYASPPVWARRR